MPDLKDYLDDFAFLRQDKNSDRYPEASRHASPHKPLLLLSVIDQVATGEPPENHFRIEPSLSDLFRDYWRIVMPPEQPPNIVMPFFHLQSEGFWHLIPTPGSEEKIEPPGRLTTIRQHHDYTEGVRLDVDLFQLLSDDDTRESLRRVLVETYFSDAVQASIVDQGRVHVEAYRYSRALLEHLLDQASASPVHEPDEPVRSRGFRMTITEAYDHRCAMTGTRIRTMDGLSIVEAAHIVPWSESRSDDPRNGLALSRDCHWAFEQGLLSVDEDYRILVAGELSEPYNRSGTLDLMAGRPLLLPDREALYPGKDYLHYHRNTIFRD